MKKCVFLIAILVLLMPLGAHAVVVAGDMNGDNRIDIVDVTSLIDCLLSKETGIAAADANGDGKVDISDLTELIDLILSGNQTFVVNGVTFSMIQVEGGTFLMGATPEQGNQVSSDEMPVHEVTLSSYKIGQTEVTQALWEAVMGSNPSEYAGYPYNPVERVAWKSCQLFIYKLNQLTGKNFRLLTEAEWEFAARGGNLSQGYMYAGSNSVGDVAWYYSNIPSHQPGTEGYSPQKVALKAPNELGIYDMSGNVFEFCQDWEGSYSSEAQTNPTGPASFTGTFEKSPHIARGGSWAKGAEACRVSSRMGYSDQKPYYYYGLRLALDPEDSPKFRLSESVIIVNLGDPETVNILNGSGQYSITGRMELFNISINGNTLTVTGFGTGISTVTITDNVTGSIAVLNVIILGSETITVNGVSFKMIFVEGGTFTMGYNNSSSDLTPHEVTLSNFLMGETEVTQALWVAVMGSNPSYFTGDMNRPVETVTWDEQVEFVTQLSQMTGKSFRIPTEAEWEYAARGGIYSNGYPDYSGSNNIDEVAWYNQNSGSNYPTHPVKMKIPNELGLYDMSGNVWERVADWYAPYDTTPQTNPTGPKSGTYRLNRGGSVAKPANQSTVWFRGAQSPTYSGRYDGLRLAMSSPL